MKLNFSYLCLFIACLVASNTSGQKVTWTYRQPFDVPLNNGAYPADSVRHTAVQPTVATVPLRKSDSLTASYSWTRRKLFHEHFLQVDTEGLWLTVDPIFNFELGNDVAKKHVEEDQPTYYTNTRGILVQGNINNKVGIVSAFYENQSVFPDYLDEYVTLTEVVPGQGRVKIADEGFDYARASGSVYYKAGRHITFMAGHGKHFIGSGYRSLLLSDNAFNYPYFRTDITFLKGKVAYTFMVNSFQSLYRLPVSTDTESLFRRKSGNFHYLSWAMTKKIRLGIFESGVYRAVDTSGKNQFEPNSINPVIGSNMVQNKNEHQKGLVGMDVNINVAAYLDFYLQLLLDGDHSDRVAFQAGMNWARPGKSSFRLEYNQVPSRIYQGSTDHLGYEHYNQSLTHPAGNDFREILAMAFIRKKRFFTRLKANYIDYDQSVLLVLPTGGNQAYYPYTDVFVQEAAVGWIVNPSNGMNVRVGVINRNNYIELLNNTSYIYFGFRTFLPSVYYDF